MQHRRHRPASRTATRSSSIGEMEEMSQTVQNANTHKLRCQNHEHAHSSRSVQGSVQWGDGTLHVGSIRGKAHILPDDAHSNGQHFSGAMDVTCVGSIWRQNSLRTATTHRKTVSIPVGRWNVTHGFDSRESSPPATHKYGDGQQTSGRWMKVQGKVQRCKRTASAVLSWILQFSKLATPLQET